MTAASATVDVVVAATIGFAMDAYSVGEADGTLALDVVMRTGTTAEIPTHSISYSVSTVSDTATTNADYSPLSTRVDFAPSDFVTIGTRHQAAKTVVINIIDDDATDPGEQFKILLERSPGLPAKYDNPVTPQIVPCPQSDCATPVTIKDDESAPNETATGKPTIAGTAQVGATLRAERGTIADADGTTKADNGDPGYAYTYQWVRLDSDGASNPEEIAGAMSRTYAPTPTDASKTLKVKPRSGSKGHAPRAIAKMRRTQ